MSERYKQVKLYDNFSFCPSCPVDILKGAIYIDTVTNKAVFQLKFINMQEKYIKALYIQIKGYDDLGAELENKEYSYLDLNIKTGQEFGTKQLQELSNNTIRNIEITITKVIYANNEVWENKNDIVYDRFPLQCIDDNLLSIARQKATEQKLQLNKIYYPTQNNNYWTCICGIYNSNSNERCYRCKSEKKENFNQYTKISLKKELSEYLELKHKRNNKSKYIFLAFAILIISLSVIVLSKEITKFDQNAMYQVFTDTGYYAIINKNGYVIELSRNEQQNLIELSFTDDITVNKKDKIDGEYLKIIETAIRKGINNIGYIQVIRISETECIYTLGIENKIVELGNTDNLIKKMTYIKSIIEQEKGKQGRIFVEDINKAYFKENL